MIDGQPVIYTWEKHEELRKNLLEYQSLKVDYYNLNKRYKVQSELVDSLKTIIINFRMSHTEQLSEISKLKRNEQELLKEIDFLSNQILAQNDRLAEKQRVLDNTFKALNRYKAEYYKSFKYRETIQILTFCVAGALGMFVLASAN